jgi:hypothetical protein
VGVRAVVYLVGGCEFDVGLWLPRRITTSDVGQVEYGRKGLTGLGTVGEW